MAIIARDRSLARPKSGGGKLNRSETVTVRLDPKLNYLCELAARAQRRTKSSFIEWSIAHSLGAAELPDVHSYNGSPVMVRDWGETLWQVDEADRVMMLAIKAPALLTHEEQLIWRVVRECGAFWLGSYRGPGQQFAWSLDADSLRFDAVREVWETIKAVAFGDETPNKLPTWKKTKGWEGASGQSSPDDLDDDIPGDSPF